MYAFNVKALVVTHTSRGVAVGQPARSWLDHNSSSGRCASGRPSTRAVEFCEGALKCDATLLTIVIPGFSVGIFNFQSIVSGKQSFPVCVHEFRSTVRLLDLTCWASISLPFAPPARFDLAFVSFQKWESLKSIEWSRKLSPMCFCSRL